MDQSEYGERFMDHKFEQYKMYIEIRDREAARRFDVHKFYVYIVGTLTLSVVAIFNIRKDLPIEAPQQLINMLLMIAIFVASSWFRIAKYLARSLKDKTAIIEELEQYLPISPFSDERRKYNSALKRPSNWLPADTEVIVIGIVLMFLVSAFSVSLLIAGFK